MTKSEIYEALESGRHVYVCTAVGMMLPSISIRKCIIKAIVPGNKVHVEAAFYEDIISFDVIKETPLEAFQSMQGIFNREQ